MKAPNYIQRLLNNQKIIETITRKGGITEIYIAHDDNCPFLCKTGPCNCEPEIRVS